MMNLIEDELEPDEEAETVSAEDMFKNYMALYEGIGLHVWNVPTTHTASRLGDLKNY